MLTNYKKIAKGSNIVNISNGTTKCGRCGLCGNHGKSKNMVLETKHVETNSKNKFIIKQNINCKNIGVYAAQCKICKEFYVGQTSTCFSDRWRGHRYNWNTQLDQNITNINTDNNQHKDDQALFHHFNKEHLNIILQKRLKIWDAYQVIFLEKTTKHRLDSAESFWIDKLKATINIQRTFLPNYK